IRLGGGTGGGGQDEAMYLGELSHAVSQMAAKSIVTSLEVCILLFSLLCGLRLGLLGGDHFGLGILEGECLSGLVVGYDALVVGRGEVVAEVASDPKEQ